MLVQLHNVHLSFFDKQVLHGVDLAIHRGDRIALVGENGSGKTSLLKIILGSLKPDSGNVAVKEGCAIGYLDQSLLGGDHEATCMAVSLGAFSHLLELEARIAKINQALVESRDLAESSRLLEELGEAMDAYEAGGGYEYRARAETMLLGVGLAPREWEKPVDSLSAGQKARLALARLLLGSYDLLLLDEPTNHLDMRAREWLAETLPKLETTYLVVSHDRTFLDAVATKVAHLDRGVIKVYPGNYTAFRRQWAQDRQAAWQTYEKRRRRVKKLEEQARSYRNWSHAKEREKRGAGDKGRIGAQAAKLAKRALVAERRLQETIEKLREEKPFEPDPIKIEFSGGKDGMLAWARDLAVGYAPGPPFARGICFELRSGERLGIAGPNGCGKSTLIKTLIREIPPLAGEVWLSQGASVGYFDQENRALPSAKSALEAVLETGKDETLVRTVLGRMGIRKESALKQIADLSWGERAKVLLARLILGDHDLLILDEPTNYLDIETQDVLLEALSGFPGGIIFVSHDRYFLDTLATEKLFLGD
ncbi:MAG TPA: ABC-F family ATP-binding cassette domain-containing protein, partial [Limnochordia bacterium]|nr:ABC-F family ATP-binding cassette domain-containing protein [Limnochordia bacterium]